MAATDERNMHPSTNHPSLHSDTPMDDVDFRIENQVLYPIHECLGIQFGIRLEITALSELLPCPNSRKRLKSALRTMPEEVVRYKSLLEIRQSIIQNL
jgi:hypothetical protein